jgi:short-subunit dehydrogenase
MNRVVVVTGASRGIGVAIAENLASDGSTVILAARDRAGLERTADIVRAAGGRPVVVAGDIGNDGERRALVAAAEAEGPIDVLVNNAAVEIPVAFHEQTIEEIQLQLHVNLNAPILLTHLVLPAMLSRKQGCVVMISSMSGKSATPYNAIYAASKHGINGFVSSLRIELESTGVQVGVVCPSFVADAGMWADSGVKAPALMREVPIAKVVAGVRKVIAGQGEVLVTPGPVRPMLALAQLAPSMNAPILRALGISAILKKRSQFVKRLQR